MTRDPCTCNWLFRNGRQLFRAAPAERSVYISGKYGVVNRGKSSSRRVRCSSGSSVSLDHLAKWIDQKSREGNCFKMCSGSRYWKWSGKIAGSLWKVCTIRGKRANEMPIKLIWDSTNFFFFFSFPYTRRRSLMRSIGKCIFVDWLTDWLAIH